MVTFDINNKDHIKEIKTCSFDDDDLMEYMIEICIESKQRSLEIFSPADSDKIDDNKLKILTRGIFADAIGNLIFIRVCIRSC